MMGGNVGSPYDRLGGADAVRALVDLFYDLMDSLPEADGVRSLHAKSLRVSREKLYLFLSGWLGGPDLYQQQYGPPMLRRRHLPFEIGVSERDQWLIEVFLVVFPPRLRASAPPRDIFPLWGVVGLPWV